MMLRSQTTPWRPLAFVILSLGAAYGFVACGSRTGLSSDEDEDVASTPDDDARVDAGQGSDARRDAPTVDARPRMDVIHAECDEAGSSLVYMVTNTKNELLSFDPATAVFRRIGVLACPGSTGTKPFSMAVDRFGIASVLYDDGRLYRVDTATADCDVTSYRVGQHGLFTFGMGYASLDDAGTEALFVASDEGDKTSGKYGRLGKIDMSTLSLTPIGTFNPSVVRAELTGSGGGDLFAFHAPEGNALSPDSFISRVDKHTANVLATDRLAGIRQGQGWAVAFWGGDLYLFTCPAATPPVGSTCDRSRVTRFRPSDKSLTQVGGLYPGVIVGAGVSTCAPH